MEWDQSRHPVEMYPIRRVYPMGGFDFLLKGFGQAISSEAEFDPQAFFISYAQGSFKISQKSAGELWMLLNVEFSASELNEDIENDLKKAKHGKQRILRMKGDDSSDGLKHLKVIFSLREAHIRYKYLEAQVNSMHFRSESVQKTVKQLRKLEEEMSELFKGFVALNGKDLYPAEIESEYLYRIKGLKALRVRLAKER